MRRRHADRLVEHAPAMDVALVALLLARRLVRLASAMLISVTLARLCCCPGPACRDRARPWCSQYLLDPFRFRESLVDSKPDFRCEFQVNATRDLAAQIFLVALECRQHLVEIAAAERHHVDGGEPHVGRHAHFRHGDEMAFEHRVMHVAARQHVGHRVAHELADAQRALRRLAGAFAMLLSCHVNQKFRSSWPGLSLQVGFTRLALVCLCHPDRKADCPPKRDARVKPGHDSESCSWNIATLA